MVMLLLRLKRVYIECACSVGAGLLPVRTVRLGDGLSRTGAPIVQSATALGLVSPPPLTARAGMLLPADKGAATQRIQIKAYAWTGARMRPNVSLLLPILYTEP